MSGEPQKYVGAVQAAVKILRRLAETDQPQGVAAVARETGLNVSTTFNILKTLTKEGLVSFDEAAKVYRVGMGVMEFAAPVMGRMPVDLIRPLMEQLAEEYRVPIALWNVAPSRRIVLTDRVIPRDIVHAELRPGSRLPDLVGAVGRCVAAARDYEKPRLEAEFQSLRWQTPLDFETYWTEVQQARRDGFAIDDGQLFRGLVNAAAVVRDSAGTPRLALSAIAISQQVAPDHLLNVARALGTAAQTVEANIYGRTRQKDSAVGKL